MARKDILFPVGRLVEGSLTKPQTTNMEGGALTTKSGPNAGQPRVDYFFAVAIPKHGEQSWAQTPWGAIIYGAGQEGFPAQMQSPTFAWKVKDGDSTIPNLKGKIPNQKEGYPGNWIVYFSSGFAPKTVNANGSAIVDPESIKLGHFVQVFGNVGSNGSAMKPGVFINHSMVAHSGFGPEIYVGPDPASVGFSNAAAPAGMSATPVAALPAAAANGAAGPATLPGVPVPTPVQVIPTVPNAAILAPPPPVAKQLTPKAAGATYDQLIGAGWTDALLVQHGYLTA